MAKKFWKFTNMTGGSAELLLYGDISDTSWWGDEVTPKQFTEDLNALGAVMEITVRINSGGGDVFAAQAIGNQLEQHSATVTARIDGLCASAATIIASHCDKVIAANDSTYMVHPVKLGICGYVGAVDLQEYLNALATIKENIIGLYVKKTGRDKDEITGWMDATSWWTAAQAKENGFVDELTDDEQEAVVENRNGLLFVNSVNMGLPFDKAPKFVQDSLTATDCATGTSSTRAQLNSARPLGGAVAEFKAAGRPANSDCAMTASSGHAQSNFARPLDGAVAKSTPAGQPEQIKEVQDMDIKTVDDLRKAYPALVDQIEQAAAEAATNAERERIRGIEDVALPGSEELTAQAKFEKPMSVSDFAVALVKGARTKGAAFLDAMRQDGEESGAEGVGNPPAPGGENPVNKAKAQAKADAEAYLESKKGRK